MNQYAIEALAMFLFVVILIPATVASGWWPFLVTALWAVVILPYITKRRRDQHKNRKDNHQ